jgi:hypothetical protein
MSMVFNMRRLKPAGPGDVRVDRATILGNPYTVGIHRSREQAIELYEQYARKRIATDPEFRSAIRGLRGKRLFCWCTPLPCHGDVLVKLCEELSR